MSSLGQEEPFARGQPYQDEKVAQHHLRRFRDHTLVFRDIKPTVGSYFNEIENFEHQCKTFKVYDEDLR